MSADDALLAVPIQAATSSLLRGPGSAPERACPTCRHLIGTPDGRHLRCERHLLVLVFPCGWCDPVHP